VAWVDFGRSDELFGLGLGAVWDRACHGALMVITSEQIRAARALLRLGRDELARLASVSVATIRRLEAANGHERVAPATVDGVRQALETAGAEFIEDGVRHRQRTSADTEALYQELLAISVESAAALAGHALLTDDELYDENGLPA